MADNDLTYHEYWKEVREIGKTVVERAKDEHGEDWEDHVFDILHEEVDGHQWVIYTAYNYDVMKLTDNAEYTIDNFGAESLERKSWGEIMAVMAFGALYGDVLDKMDV